VRDGVRAEQRAGHRPDHQPADEARVHGAAAEVDAATDGFHHDRGDEIAGHRRERLDAEADHQDRGHERAAAHTSEADDETDDQTRERDAEIDVHERATS
jgi:hypothetical protein